MVVDNRRSTSFLGGQYCVYRTQYGFRNRSSELQTDNAFKKACRIEHLKKELSAGSAFANSQCLACFFFQHHAFARRSIFPGSYHGLVSPSVLHSRDFPHSGVVLKSVQLLQRQIALGQ